MRDPNMDPEDQPSVGTSSPAADAAEIPGQASTAASDSDGPAASGDPLEALIIEPVTGEPGPQAPAEDEPVLGTANEVPGAQEPPAPADAEAEIGGQPAEAPAGSQVAVAEPAPAAAPHTGGVWTDEQVAAMRARVREATASVVDKAAGAVIDTVNVVAAAIRSRTQSGRGGNGRRG